MKAYTHLTVGRMMKSCPTRGGNVFEYVIHILTSSSTPIPLRAEKLEIILTGKLREDDEVYPSNFTLRCLFNISTECIDT